MKGNSIEVFMVRIKWGGSLAGYIVIGVVLVAVVSGSVYLVQQRGKQARLATASALAKKQAAASVSTTETGASSSQPATQTANPPETDTTTSSGESNSTQTTTSTSVTSSTPNVLPTTGPSMSPAELFGIGLLVATVTSYFLSRRMLARSL